MYVEKNIKVKSLAKAVQVLNCFIEKQPLGVTEISNKLGLYKSNVYDILVTLTAMHYLEQDEETGKYSLGIGAYRLSKAVGDRFSFRIQAREHIKMISNEVGEISCFTVPMEDKVCYLNVAFPTNTNMHLYGAFQDSMDEFYRTSCGKAMLAGMPEAFVEEYLKRPMPALTEYTITDPDKLRAELVSIRLRGYAVDRMENSVGLSCVAVPILARDKTVKGALSISGPSERMTDERMAELASVLKTHVLEIQRDM